MIRIRYRVGVGKFSEKVENMSNYSSNDRQGETGPNRLIHITICPDG